MKENNNPCRFLLHLITAILLFQSHSLYAAEQKYSEDTNANNTAKKPPISLTLSNTPTFDESNVAPSDSPFTPHSSASMGLRDYFLRTPKRALWQGPVYVERYGDGFKPTYCMVTDDDKLYL